jgi:hypothetical protein
MNKQRTPNNITAETRHSQQDVLQECQPAFNTEYSFYTAIMPRKAFQD